MDDMKREMCMRVKNSILAGKKHYLCWALVDELADFCNVTWAGGTFLIQGGAALNSVQVDVFLEDIFPEFFALYDETWWVDEWLDSPKKYSITKNPHGAWFPIKEVKRRLRILDFLLTYQPSSPTLFLT